MSVDQFITRLRGTDVNGNAANPYNCFVENVDQAADSSRQRSLQLSAYLRHRLESARFLLIAEAPGFQGARFSGIAMTSERLLSNAQNFVTERDILGQEGLFSRTSHANACRNRPARRHGFTEPTATIVWRAIMEANRAREVVLWNTFPFHPHRRDYPLTNRKPTLEEINHHAGILADLRGLFRANCRVVAIGNVAWDHLNHLNVIATHIRHPANGGATDFRRDFERLFDLG